jgi:hypothetical protein
MAVGNLQAGTPKLITATGNLNNSSGALLGVLVSSSTAGTFQLYDSATTTTTTPITGLVTPVAGQFIQIPVGYATGLYVVVTGTIDATLILV